MRMTNRNSSSLGAANDQTHEENHDTHSSFLPQPQGLDGNELNNGINDGSDNDKLILAHVDALLQHAGLQHATIDPLSYMVLQKTLKQQQQQHEQPLPSTTSSTESHAGDRSVLPPPQQYSTDRDWNNLPTPTTTEQRILQHLERQAAILLNLQDRMQFLSEQVAHLQHQHHYQQNAFQQQQQQQQQQPARTNRSRSWWSSTTRSEAPPTSTQTTAIPPFPAAAAERNAPSLAQVPTQQQQQQQHQHQHQQHHPREWRADVGQIPLHDQTQQQPPTQRAPPVPRTDGAVEPQELAPQQQHHHQQQQQQHLILFSLAVALWRGCVAMGSTLWNSRPCKIVRFFWALRQQQVPRIDWGLLFKVFIMAAILITRVQRKHQAQAAAAAATAAAAAGGGGGGGTTHSNSWTTSILSIKFLLLAIILVVAFLFHTGQAQFLYQFCVVKQYPRRIWQGEDLTVDDVVHEQADATRQARILPNAAAAAAAAADGGVHGAVDDPVAAVVVAGPGVQGNAAAVGRRGLGRWMNNLLAIDWTNTFLAGRIAPRLEQGVLPPPLLHPQPDGPQQPQQASVPWTEYVWDVFILIASFFLSIFPMWRPERARIIINPAANGIIEPPPSSPAAVAAADAVAALQEPQQDGGLPAVRPPADPVQAADDSDNDDDDEDDDENHAHR